jgi:hypothetical protein
LHLVLDGLVLQLGPELPEAEGQLHIPNVTLRELSIEGEIYNAWMIGSVPSTVGLWSGKQRARAAHIVVGEDGFGDLLDRFEEILMFLRCKGFTNIITELRNNRWSPIATVRPTRELGALPEVPRGLIRARGTEARL